MKAGRRRGGASPEGHFPVKLYAMLELAGAGGLGPCSGAVAWLPHGRAFRIVDRDAFMDGVVPLFFKQTKLRSFHRQLNLWGFKRLTGGPDAGAWYHGSFLRGLPEEMSGIVRVQVKGDGAKTNDPTVVRGEPDFWRMPPLPSTCGLGGSAAAVEAPPCEARHPACVPGGPPPAVPAEARVGPPPSAGAPLLPLSSLPWSDGVACAGAAAVLLPLHCADASIGNDAPHRGSHTADPVLSALSGPNQWESAGDAMDPLRFLDGARRDGATLFA